MAGDRQLTVKILGDSSGAEKALGNVDDHSSRLSGTVGKLGVALAGAFAVDKLVGLGKAGIGVAADFQQTTIAFNTMLGSGEKASAFLKDLRAFAAKTPFEFPELATAASSLISVGVETSKVIPIMTSLGNATAGMGTGSEGVKRATVALQQMSAAGRITGEDLNQLRDAGVPVFDLLSAATGKSKEEVAKLAQAGKLGKKEMEQLFKALETGKGLERFNGLMEKQSATLKGVISTLRDTLSNIAIDFITPYLPAMTRALQSFADLIQNRVVPAMTGVVKAFTILGEGDAQGFAEVLDNLAGNSGRLVGPFRDIGQALIKLKDGFAGLATAAGPVLLLALSGLGAALLVLVDGLARVVLAITDPKQSLTDFGMAATAAALVAGTLLAAFVALQGVNAAAGAIDSVATSVQGFANAGSKMKEIAAGQVSDITGLVGRFKDSKKATAEAASAVDGLRKSYAGLESAALQTTLAGDEKATKALKDEMADLEKQLKKMGETPYKVDIEADENKGKKLSSGLISGLAGGIGGAIVAAIDIGAIGTALAGVGTAVAAVVFSIPALIVAAVAAAAVTVFHFRKGIVHFFSDTLPRFLTEQIPNAFRSAASAISGAVSSAFGASKEGLGAVKDFLFEKGSDLIDGIKRGVAKGATELLESFKSMPNDIAFAIGFLGGFLYKHGKDLISGLWDGVTYAWQGGVHFWIELPGNIADFFVNAYQWIKDKGALILTGMWDGIKEEWNREFKFWTELPGNIADFFVDAYSWIKDKGALILTGLWDGIKAGWNASVGFFIDLPGHISDFFVGAPDWIKLHGGGLIGGLWDGIKAGWRDVIAWFHGVRGWVIDAVPNAKDWLIEAGKDVLRGLLNGVGALWDSVYGKMKSLGSSVIDGFKKGAGISSPSRLMHESGVFLMQGLANGINATRSLVDDAMGDVLGVVNLDGSSGFAMASGGANGGVVNHNYNINAPGAYAEPITEQGLALLTKRMELATPGAFTGG